MPDRFIRSSEKLWQRLLEQTVILSSIKDLLLTALGQTLLVENRQWHGKKNNFLDLSG